MIKINWTQIKNVRVNLQQKGYKDDSLVVVMVFFRTAPNHESFKVPFGKLMKFLYDLEGNQNVIEVYVLDHTRKRPLWRTKEHDRNKTIEEVPTSGHPGIIIEFDKMSPEQKDVYVNITEACILEFQACGEEL